MKPTLIGSRYLYTPSSPVYSNSFIQIFKAYDKVTKRQLLMQIQQIQSQFMQLLRQHKHTFIHYIYDKVTAIQPISNEQKRFYILQPGILSNLQHSLKKIKHFTQEDSLVMFKYILLIYKQFHNKNVPSHLIKICLQNILICTHSLIKFGYNIINDEQWPIEYYSPEKLNNKEINDKSNIYTLGVVLYKLMYGVYPFVCESNQGEKELSKKIKTKKFNTNNCNSNGVNNHSKNQDKEKIKSPLQIAISRQVHFLVMSMLDFHPQNRPQLQSILNNQIFTSIQIQTQLQKYLKPKGSLIPQTFHKKYLIYRPSKLTLSHHPYYSQISYLIFHTQSLTFMTLYLPQIRMFQSQPRKVQSYYQKLRAIMKNYKLPGCEHVVRIDDVQRFRQQPIIVQNYCNQGDLYKYLEKRKLSTGWVSETETNVIMYLVAIGLKQMKQINIGTLHTISHKRILIHNTNLKLREPGLLSPIIQKKLCDNNNIIDFFAPQLKQKLDFVQLDKSDIWSYGILYIYLLTGELPKLDTDGQYQNNIDLTQLKTHKKNVNLIGKCIDFNVKKRMELDGIKIQNVDESMLGYMLGENKNKGYDNDTGNNNNKELRQQFIDNDSENQSQLQKNLQNGGQVNISQLSSNAQQLQNNQKVMFKHRKKRLFKHYNKIISQSTTSSCRLFIKSLFGLLILWLVFFGIFFINGGIGLLRTNFYRKITLEVPYNYGTSLYNMTILSTNGGLIAQNYNNFSYEQFMIDLRCYENIYNKKQSQDEVWNFINSGQTVYCLFGFVWAIAVSVVYVVGVYRLDLPGVMIKRKEKQRAIKSGALNKIQSKTLNKQIYHFLITNLLLIPSLMFTFFYTFAFEYFIQTTPCLGIQNLAYPKFTSIQTILSGNMSKFFTNVFLTIILWAVLLFSYSFCSFYYKKLNFFLYEWIQIIPFSSIMFIFTLITRIGFGSATPLQPTWSYKMNTDITSKYYGLFGFFPEILYICIIVGNLLIDFLFWGFLKIGLRPVEEEDIKRVPIVKARFEKLETKEHLNEKSNIYMIENAYDFERFD